MKTKITLDGLISTIFGSGTITDDISGTSSSGSSSESTESSGLTADDVGLELLWTNESATSNFGAQTITVDGADGYDWFLFIWVSSTNSGSVNTETLCLNGAETRCSINAASNRGIYRDIAISDKWFVFGNGYYNGSSSAAYCIPVKIFGVKGWSL